jgi:hypothetical protein
MNMPSEVIEWLEVKCEVTLMEYNIRMIPTIYMASYEIEFVVDDAEKGRCVRDLIRDHLPPGHLYLLCFETKETETQYRFCMGIFIV